MISQDPREFPDVPGYEIVALLDRGGTSLVYRGRHRALGRPVAIKLLHDVDAEMRARHQREAEILSRIDHPSVIKLLDFGLIDDVPFLVFPLLMGMSLEGALRKRGCLTLGEVLRIGGCVLDGLEAAHRHGVLHRDLKPGNIWVEDEGQVLVIDFGFARVHSAANLTKTGIFVGTPEYASPEQVIGDPLDHRSDLYSLGVVLYQMVTGQSPFAGATVAEILRRQVNDRIARVEAASGDLPPALEQLILRLLEKDPANRPESVEKVRQMLEEAGRAASKPTGPGGPEARTQVLRSVPAVTSLTRRTALGVAAAGLAAVLLHRVLAPDMALERIELRGSAASLEALARVRAGPAPELELVEAGTVLPGAVTTDPDGSRTTWGPVALSRHSSLTLRDRGAAAGTIEMPGLVARSAPGLAALRVERTESVGGARARFTGAHAEESHEIEGSIDGGQIILTLPPDTRRWYWITLDQLQIDGGIQVAGHPAPVPWTLAMVDVRSVVTAHGAREWAPRELKRRGGTDPFRVVFDPTGRAGDDLDRQGILDDLVVEQKDREGSRDFCRGVLEWHEAVGDFYALARAEGAPENPDLEHVLNMLIPVTSSPVPAGWSAHSVPWERTLLLEEGLRGVDRVVDVVVEDSELARATSPAGAPEGLGKRALEPGARGPKHVLLPPPAGGGSGDLSLELWVHCWTRPYALRLTLEFGGGEPALTFSLRNPDDVRNFHHPDPDRRSDVADGLSWKNYPAVTSRLEARLPRVLLPSDPRSARLEYVRLPGFEGSERAGATLLDHRWSWAPAR